MRPLTALTPGGNLRGLTPLVNQYRGRLHISEINAGEVVVPAEGALVYVVTGFSIRAREDAIGGLTALRIIDTSSTPNVIASAAQAQLTADNYLNPDSTGITLGAYFQQELPAGQGIKIDQTGDDATGGPNVDITIDYHIVDGVEIMGGSSTSSSSSTTTTTTSTTTTTAA